MRRDVHVLEHANERQRRRGEGAGLARADRVDAGAVEQLVIEEEFNAAQLNRPIYGITGWVILTLIQ